MIRRLLIKLVFYHHLSTLSVRMKPEHESEFKGLIHSFGYAIEGWSYAIRHERSVWIHVVMTAAVIAIGTWLNVSRTDWALLVLAMGMVWMAELMNTAVETLVDLVSPEFNPLAKVAKDTAAGAVLVAALAAFVIGLLILGPPLWTVLFA